MSFSAFILLSLMEEKDRLPVETEATLTMMEHHQRNEFRLGEIEYLPVADRSVDVIISNCVINLSADKGRVLREVAVVRQDGLHPLPRLVGPLHRDGQRIKAVDHRIREQRRVHVGHLVLHHAAEHALDLSW